MVSDASTTPVRHALLQRLEEFNLAHATTPTTPSYTKAFMLLQLPLPRLL